MGATQFLTISFGFRFVTKNTFVYTVLLSYFTSVLSLSPDLIQFPSSTNKHHLSANAYFASENCESNCFAGGKVSSSKSGDLVCGSDGVTYLSFEELDCVRRNCGRNIWLEHYGRCHYGDVGRTSNELGLVETEDTTATPLPAMDKYLLRILAQSEHPPVANERKQSLAFPQPISEGGTGGEEEFRAPKRFPYPSTPNKLRGNKKVCLPDECDCSGEEFRPVCGSDSVTYGSVCLMECNRECNPDVVKYHDGHCGKLFLKDECRSDGCGCPDDLQPVCGSNSVTYLNRCSLECARNCNPDVQYNHEGYCGRLFFPKSQQVI